MAARSSASQAWVLLAAAVSQLVWGLPAAAAQMHTWRARAQAIVDAPTREDALNVQRVKRGHVDGAALFWILVKPRRPRLLRLLVAYELMLDFLDYASERGQTRERDLQEGVADGRQLHLGLIDALDTGRAIATHYAHHPWRADAGYLRALVLACRAHTTALPSYPRTQALAVAEVRRAADVLALNHIPDPGMREERLRTWAAQHPLTDRQLTWFEHTAAISGSLAVHVLLTQAADPRCGPAQLQSAYDAYMPWVALATAMLDSYADQIEDAAAREHSYIAHYDDPDAARARLEQIVAQTMRRARRLPNGQRHAVIVASMIAMYLSKEDARSSALHASSRSIAAAGGHLSLRLLPVLRLWRLAFSHRSA
jgi:tetraprenyl-beta-curcumene synthase